MQYMFTNSPRSTFNTTLYCFIESGNIVVESSQFFLPVFCVPAERERQELPQQPRGPARRGEPAVSPTQPPRPAETIRLNRGLRPSSSAMPQALGLYIGKQGGFESGWTNHVKGLFRRCHNYTNHLKAGPNIP